MRRYRSIAYQAQSVPTMEGAGVKLRRAFGFRDPSRFDPFLLLDDFRGDEPDDYIKGFPWHPHRGIETITYMLEGSAEHGDSLGNKGVIGPGAVQWMTAGSGIIHQEMPKPGEDGRMGGFQLWANLPRASKMMDPRYQELDADQIPEVEIEGGRVKVVAGSVAGVRGPVQDVVIEPEYLDLELGPGAVYEHPTTPGHTQIAYVVTGQASFGAQDEGRSQQVPARTVLLFGDGEALRIETGDEPVHALLISGKPLKEPIAWQGPIVMNTQEELATAFEEYQRGTFIKVKN